MFLNREEAGLRLAVALSKEKNTGHAVIFGIPRGGIVVARALSDVLNLPLSALLVKKIGAPDNPELAIGATGSNGVVFWDEELLRRLDISTKNKVGSLRYSIKTIKAREKSLGIEPPKKGFFRKKNAIIVDDGVATGATAIAASLILKKIGSPKVILATPVISKHTKRQIAKYFNKIIAVETPDDFSAVGEFYQEFPQVADKEVQELLSNSTIDS